MSVEDIKSFANYKEAIDLPKHLQQLYDLLKDKGIDMADLEKARVNRINIWQTMHKNSLDEAEITDLAGIELSPAWASGPEWPVVQPGPKYRVPSFQKSTKLGGWDKAVILPDMQIGYFRNKDDELEATHDEKAMSIALAIANDAKPTQIVMVGDNLDLPEFGKYRLTPTFARTTQAAVDRGALLCAQLRQAAPNAEIVWIEGNHEVRLPNVLIDNATAAFGLRRGGAPDSWPLLSVPNLLNFDEYGINYLAGYPASRHYITSRIAVIHGDVVRQGTTADVYLNREKTSVVYGHIHRREWSERTRDDYDGPRTVMAASPGCLCRTDGAVPSVKGGVDVDGRPIHREENWQQGLAVVEYDSESGAFAYEQISIHYNRALWRGKIYTSN